jgi:hypothetical protein
MPLERPSAAATHTPRGSANRQTYLFGENQNKSYLKVPVNKYDELTLHLFQAPTRPLNPARSPAHLPRPVLRAPTAQL